MALSTTATPGLGGKTLVPTRHRPRDGIGHGSEEHATSSLAHDASSDGRVAGEVVDEAAMALRQAAELGYKDGYAEGHGQGREAGHLQGQALGYEEGIRQGVAAGREQLREHVESLAALSRDLSQARQGVLHSAEDDLTCIVYEALCKLVGNHLVTRAGIVAQVQTVVDRVAEQRGIRVRLHPRDLALLDEQGQVELPGVSIDWCADATIGFGGCVVEAAAGEFRARLDEQLRQVLCVLQKVRNEAPVGAADCTDEVQQANPVLPTVSATVTTSSLPPSEPLGELALPAVVDVPPVIVADRQPSPKTAGKTFSMKWGAS